MIAPRAGTEHSGRRAQAGRAGRAGWRAECLRRLPMCLIAFRVQNDHDELKETEFSNESVQKRQPIARCKVRRPVHYFRCLFNQICILQSRSF